MEYLGVLPASSPQSRQARLSKVSWKEIFVENQESKLHSRKATPIVRDACSVPTRVQSRLFRYEPRHTLDFARRPDTWNDARSETESVVSTRTQGRRGKVPLHVVGNRTRRVNQSTATALHPSSGSMSSTSSLSRPEVDRELQPDYLRAKAEPQCYKRWDEKSYSSNPGKGAWIPESKSHDSTYQSIGKHINVPTNNDNEILINNATNKSRHKPQDETVQDSPTSRFAALHDQLDSARRDLISGLEGIWETPQFLQNNAAGRNEWTRSRANNQERVPWVSVLTEHQVIPLPADMKHLTSSLLRRHLENVHLYSKVRDNQEELLATCMIPEIGSEHRDKVTQLVVSDLIYFGGQIAHVMQRSPKLVTILLEQYFHSDRTIARGFASLICNGLMDPFIASENHAVEFVSNLVNHAEKVTQARKTESQRSPLWAGSDFTTEEEFNTPLESNSPLWMVLEEIAGWELHINYFRQYWLEALEHPAKDPLDLVFSLLSPIFLQDPATLPPTVLAISHMLQDSNGKCGVHAISFLFECWIGGSLDVISNELHGRENNLQVSGDGVRVEFLMRTCAAQHALRKLCDALVSCCSHGYSSSELDRHRGKLRMVEDAMMWVERINDTPCVLATHRAVSATRLPSMSNLAALSRGEISLLIRTAQYIDTALGRVAPSRYEVKEYQHLARIGMDATKLLKSFRSGVLSKKVNEKESNKQGSSRQPHSHLPHKVNVPREGTRMVVVTLQDPSRDPVLDSSSDAMFWALHDSSRLQFLVQQGQEALARESFLSNSDAGLSSRVVEVTELAEQLQRCQGLAVLLCSYQQDAEHGLLRANSHRQLMEIKLRRSRSAMRPQVVSPKGRQLPELDPFDDDSEFFDILE